MAKSGTASLTIAELREFASFTEDEQLFIERSLDVGLGRGDAFKLWSDRDADAIRSQYLAYRELRALREAIPAETALDGDRLAQRAQFAVGEVLAADRVGVAAGPLLEGVAAAEPDVEPAFDEQLLGLGEAGEFAQLGDGQ